ncbi:hypothetical protein GLOIN_2v1784798 [Rhizophagus irregularis DAOM 181602=DAOM 197198]|nr:hypothetical protein GLOIN_2v1784798 [Rhizophagus irregularis DAOM 181602=DAOM 197198]
MISSRANNSRERNTTTRTFFNFTYKKYRFHFGIYIPCSQQHPHSTFYDSREHCQVPSPFVMSQCRRACVMHQSIFFHNENLNGWNCRWKKDVISHRLGISYKESYLARSKGSVIHHANKHMYRKWLDTFSIQRSKNVKTAKAQEIRFRRACRRTFHAKEHNNLDTMRHRLITAVVAPQAPKPDLSYDHPLSTYLRHRTMPPNYDRRTMTTEL